MATTIAQAFRRFPRAGFVPKSVAAQAEWDVPLPIGYGQTNSQPTTVRRMLEWLEVKPGNHVLDIGSGSGWTSALLSELTGPAGDVVAVEIVPELVDYGRENCAHADVHNIRFHSAGPDSGFPAAAPYDRILVSASAHSVPPGLLDQLAPDGTMVIPVGGDIRVLHKTTDGSVKTESHPGYVFVPLL